MSIKPTWDQYLMTLAFVVSSRSIDPNTKVGCVIVDQEHTILSVGYNSPPRGCDDKVIPLSRPDKYMYFVHAEEAAIANAARNGTCLKGGIAYVTSVPCPTCLRMLINAGIVEVVTGPIGTTIVDETKKKAIEIMCYGRNGFHIRAYQMSAGLSLLDDVKEHYYAKLGEKNGNA